MYWQDKSFKLAAENCDKLGILVYEDLGCTPVYNSKPCPIKYKCENWEKLDTNKCHYKGKSYNQGEELPDTGVPCDNGCSCTKIYDK
ncbi:hypothetical protein BDFB_013129 [Asbolus verrucosus]|uniref:Uncharacterized protein n=1 Tax=Asbolus verrucosus TaxID=1661398 RepID=A0A482VFT7_ASBVE|nr:hypothetical protein BDFB_013129 [Asbolus verrucosus]